MKRSGSPTINDVARLAGVSKKTVSRVINNSPLLHDGTRDRVTAVIRELSYTPNPQARALALRRTHLIGLIYDNPNAETVMNVQRGMLETLRSTEYEMIVHPLDRTAPNMLGDLRRFLERQRLFGVLLMPPVSEDDAVAALCAELGCRYVRMASAMLDGAQRMVASNDRQAVREAAGHLIALGHRRIAHIAGPADYRSARERRAGFEDALEAAGLSVPPEMVVEGDYTFESGVIVAEQLLTLTPRPTALFCSSDTMAAGALHAARARGLEIPDDLSIIGFDDTPIAAHVWPPLTTVRWPTIAMARAAARKLIAEPETGDAVIEAALFPSSLIERGSVAAPRAA